VRSMIAEFDRDERGRVSLKQIVSETGALPTGTSEVADAGFVDPVELMAAAVKSSVYLRQRHLEVVFKTFDRNGDGKIDLNELRQALASEGSEQDALEIMNDADRDADGFISFEEFCNVMR